MSTRLRTRPDRRGRELSLGEGVQTFGLWSDGTTVWVADWLEGEVLAYSLADGARAEEFDIDTGAAGNAAPTGMWSDGETVWVADSDDAKLYAYVMSVPGDEPPGPVNGAPETVGSLSPLLLGVSSGPATVELSGAFSDPDGRRADVYGGVVGARAWRRCRCRARRADGGAGVVGVRRR